jgi:hypothetical protein
MALYDDIVKVYSELTAADFNQRGGSILLQDDGDGVAYIAKWDYTKPIPDGLKLGK